jgi:hypothetical protein
MKPLLLTPVISLLLTLVMPPLLTPVNPLNGAAVVVDTGADDVALVFPNPLLERLRY